MPGETRRYVNAAYLDKTLRVRFERIYEPRSYEDYKPNDKGTAYSNALKRHMRRMRRRLNENMWRMYSDKHTSKRSLNELEYGILRTVRRRSYRSMCVSSRRKVNWLDFKDFFRELRVLCESIAGANLLETLFEQKYYDWEEATMPDDGIEVCGVEGAKT